MKNLILLIIQLSGYAFVFVSVISAINMFTGWELGYQGSEVPGEPEFAIFFLILGLIIIPVSWLLNKKFEH